MDALLYVNINPKIWQPLKLLCLKEIVPSTWTRSQSFPGLFQAHWHLSVHWCKSVPQLQSLIHFSDSSSVACFRMLSSAETELRNRFWQMNWRQEPTQLHQCCPVTQTFTYKYFCLLLVVPACTHHTDWWILLPAQSLLHWAAVGKRQRNSPALHLAGHEWCIRLRKLDQGAVLDSHAWLSGLLISPFWCWSWFCFRGVFVWRFVFSAIKIQGVISVTGFWRIM